MSKHIPGPWVIDKVSGGWAVRAPKWGYVAIHETSGLSHFDERQEANRRLIAAAPDLLAALTAAVEAIEHGGLDDVMCCNGWNCGCRAATNGDRLVHDLRAAIAKATGEA